METAGNSFSNFTCAYNQRTAVSQLRAQYLAGKHHRRIAYGRRLPAYRRFIVDALSERHRTVKQLGENRTGSPRLVGDLPRSLHLPEYLHLSKDKRVYT